MNWIKLSQIEEKLFWDNIYEREFFNPYGKKFKLIKPKGICHIYDISKYYNQGFNEEYYNDLHSKAIEVFKEINSNDNLIALSWQHEGYSFSPFLPFEKDEFDEWLITLFPDGECNFFCVPDFSNYIFSDGINCSIYIVGDKIINAFMKNKPLMLQYASMIVQ